MEVGKTVKGKREKGPACDRKRAHCAKRRAGDDGVEEEEILHAGRCLELPATGKDARFIPKVFHFCEEAGERASAAACHSGGTNPPRLQPARFSSLQMSTFFGTRQRAHNQSRDVRMSLMDHQDAVCPTGPNVRPPSTWRRFEAHNLQGTKAVRARSCAFWVGPAPRSRERHD